MPNNPNNILYAECEIPWDLTYTDNTGKEHSLDFGTYCNEDGTLKDNPFTRTSESTPNYKELTGIDLMALYDQGEKKISEELDKLDDLTAEERQTYLNEFAQ